MPITLLSGFVIKGERMVAKRDSKILGTFLFLVNIRVM